MKRKQYLVEYNQLIVSWTQYAHDILSNSIVRSLSSDEHDFNNINFYYDHDFCDMDTYSKYYEKLSFRKFKDVLSFLNKVGNWEIHSITPINVSGHTYPDMLYTFERDVEVGIN